MHAQAPGGGKSRDERTQRRLRVRGPKVHLDGMKVQMETKYEMKELTRLGPGKDDGKEMKIVNRFVRWINKRN